jgi:hypothetical protein
MVEICLFFSCNIDVVVIYCYKKGGKSYACWKIYMGWWLE